MSPQTCSRAEGRDNWDGWDRNELPESLEPPTKKSAFKDRPLCVPRQLAELLQTTGGAFSGKEVREFCVRVPSHGSSSHCPLSVICEI